ncbi:MAG: hypothetical protein HN590_16115 [Calditrichaeota bacterium]|jgi:hypothetical protein|nr:hypothetical protein [Bacteroidota bacterium]MBT7618801.1 hypothetical protein [Calditrichota bacterium]
MNSILKIGIDPGINTGYTELENGKIVFIKTLTFWTAVKRLEILAALSQKEKNQLQVFIEDPGLIKPTFPRDVNQAVKQKISQDVGRNKRDAQLLIELCEQKGIPVTRVRPSSRTMTKLPADKFKMITKYTGRTSEHARDACMLVWGR